VIVFTSDRTRSGLTEKPPIHSKMMKNGERDAILKRLATLGLSLIAWLHRSALLSSQKQRFERMRLMIRSKIAPADRSNLLNFPSMLNFSSRAEQ
jgi:hypothetical protein